MMTGNEGIHVNLDPRYQMQIQAFVVRRNILEPLLFNADDLLLHGTIDIYYEMFWR